MYGGGEGVCEWGEEGIRLAHTIIIKHNGSHITSTFRMSTCIFILLSVMAVARCTAYII